MEHALVRRHNVNRDPSLHRRHRQERADSFVRMAARRDGWSNTCVRADSRRDHGDGRRVHGGALLGDLHARAVRHVHRRDHWRGHGTVRGNHRPGPKRYQESSRLLDDFAAWLHVHGLWRRGVRRHLSRDDACVFQSATVSRLGLSHSRHASRAGHAAHGWPPQVHADHLADDVRRLARNLWCADLGRLLFKR